MRNLLYGRAGRVALLTGAALPLLLSPSAYAQSADDEETATGQDGGQIVVTGSRILRPDFNANSPILSVDEALLEQSSTASIEANLNKLPQFSAAKTATQGGDIQPTSQNTPGSATISLRGIGSNRSLVLLDGRRATPANATGVIDINTIPSSAIERVEIISGGASSTYGADAVGGVVNFILKKNFQGLELDGQVGITQEGDGFEYRFSGIMGTDFADGRGNVSLSLSMNTRELSRQRERSWYRDRWADSSVGGTDTPHFLGFTTGLSNHPDIDVVNSVIDGANFTNLNNVMIYSDYEGNAFTGFGATGVPGVSGFTQPVDNYDYKLLDNGQLGWTYTDSLLLLPLTRYNMYARGNYEINDWLGVFAQGHFSHVGTNTEQFGTSVRGGWAAHIDPSINRGVIPDEILTILDSRENPNETFEISWRYPLNRTAESDVYTYNLVTGLEGSVPGMDWTWEAFVSHGETQSSVHQTGFASLERFRHLLSLPNFGEGATITGNEEGGGFGAASATCTSGFNIFNPAMISQDCYEAVTADIKSRSAMRQTIVEANLQGSLFGLPAGDLRFAAGASYRENDYEFTNDTLTSQGRSFLDQALGLYPSGNSAGLITVRELYGELLVPVFSNSGSFFQELNLELGGRISDYSTTGTSYTYKALADLRLTDWLRLRGGYNRAERAPNIAELFLAPEQTFAAASGGDVCSTRNGLAFSANPDANADYQQAIALCGQLMEATGDATADEQYYGADWRVLAAADPATLRDLVTQPQGAGAANVFPTLSGNADLRPETADTWTAGVVIDSPFSGALGNLRLAVDYYNIRVKDAIGAQSVDIVLRQCFDTAFNPTLDADHALCAGAARNQNGALGNVMRTFLNNGRFQTSGIDVQLDWAIDVGPGQLSLNSVFNYLLEMKAAELSTDAMREYAGTQGPTNNGLNGSSYEYKVLTTIGYRIGGTYLGLQWRHLPSIRSQTSVLIPDTTATGVTESYNLFNLQGSHRLNDATNLRFGVDNLFNKAPPVSGRNPGAVLPSLPGGGYDSQNYDTVGRRFYLGANFAF